MARRSSAKGHGIEKPEANPGAVSSLTLALRALGRRLRGITRQQALAFVLANWRPITLLVLSAALAAFYLCGKPIVIYDDSDPLSYVRKAWSFIHREGGIDVAYRGPGYPLFLILTGMAWLDTWWVLIPTQIVMAITIPVLIYGTLAPVTRNGGFVAALLFMSSGVAYHHMNWVMAEPLFLFVQFLVFFLVARHFFEKNGGNLFYVIAVLIAYLAMVRPSGSYYFWIYVFACLAFRIENWRRCLKAAAIYVSIMFLWGTFDYYHGRGRFPSAYVPGTITERYFADVYFGGEGYDQFTQPPRTTIAPADGPASGRLYDAVGQYVRANRGKWASYGAVTSRQLFDRFGGDDGALIRNMFTKPNFVYLDVIIRAANAVGGGHDRLLYFVDEEHGNTGVSAIAKYYFAHPQILAFGAPQTYIGRQFLATFYRYSEMEKAHYFFVGGLHRNLVKEEAGPKTKEFLETVLFMLDTFPQYTLEDGNHWLEIFGSLDKMKAYILDPYPWTLPDGRSVLGQLEGSIYVWASNYYGEVKVDHLMRDAAFEIIGRTPSSLFVFFDNFLRITMMRHFNLDYGSISSWSEFGMPVSAALWPTDMKSTVLPNSLAKYLTVPSPPPNWISDILYFQYYFLWRLLKIVFFFLMVAVAVPLLLLERTRALTAFLLLIYFYNAVALTAVLGNFDLARYEDLFIFMPVMISIMGIFLLPGIARSLRRPGRRRSKTTAARG